MDEKRTITNVFNQSATVYDRVGPRFFSHFGARLVDLVNPSDRNRVLDIAAGRGAILFPSAEKIGREGQVIGIDISEMMVKVTSEDIRERGLQNAEIRQMDAENLEFPNASFDALFCGFGIFLFPQLDRALGEFRRVLKPGGKIGVTTFGKSDERWHWYGELIKEYAVPSYSIGKRLASSAFNTPDGIKNAITSAGFADARVTVEELELVFANEQEWWSRLSTLGARIPFDEMKTEVLEKFKADAFKKIQVNKEPDGFHQLQTVLLTVAIKPND